MLFTSLSRDKSVQNVQGEHFAIELRLDLFSRIDLDEISVLIEKCQVPILLTLRKSSQGGKFKGSEEEREILIEKLLSIHPSFFDLESDMRPEFLSEVMRKYPKIKFILSYHCFQNSLPCLEEILKSMERYPAFSYKIALFVRSTNEALKMLLFAKNNPKVSAICMGEEGKFARVLGPVVGNAVNFACSSVRRKTAPGQLTLSELLDIYNYPSLNEKTAIYGLIGDPVEKSKGHLYHNAIFRKRHINAVYVKMRIRPEELAEFFSLAHQIGIFGLSVTSPLKEKVLPLIDEMDQSARKIGAVNTLLFRKGKMIGTNTDGLGALDAIEKRLLVRGKKVVLLGAGGAARAIAFEAKKRGADVLILNRAVQKAKMLALDFGCETGELKNVPSDYDILINSTPDPMPIDPKSFREESLVMDIVYVPKKTLFLKAASQKKCRVIYGKEMFLNQAARQTAFWLDG